jgi:hypothetical protein
MEVVVFPKKHLQSKEFWAVDHPVEFFFEILNTPKIAQIYPMAPDEYLILVTDFSGQG